MVGMGLNTLVSLGDEGVHSAFTDSAVAEVSGFDKSLVFVGFAAVPVGAAFFRPFVPFDFPSIVSNGPGSHVVPAFDPASVIVRCLSSLPALSMEFMLVRLVTFMLT